jgi:hypothetical protein
MLAWIGNLLIVVGLYKIGDKWRHAFLFSIAGEILYIARSVAVKDWALAFICVVFCAMAFRNWIKWGEDDTAARLLEGVNEKGGVYELGLPAADPAEHWVAETYTKHWYGKNGGEAVSVRLKSTGGLVCDFVLSNHQVARSFGEALIRHADQISRPRPSLASQINTRALLDPRPRGLTPDDRYMS